MHYAENEQPGPSRPGILCELDLAFRGLCISLRISGDTQDTSALQVMAIFSFTFHILLRSIR